MPLCTVCTWYQDITDFKTQEGAVHLLQSLLVPVQVHDMTVNVH